MMLILARKSLANRKGSVLLTILAMAVSLIVLLSVDHIRQQTKTSFASTVSGVDLIVGSRTSGLILLLYSVFRIGNPTANISWTTYSELSNHPKVAWTIPISLGDSHKGYRVMGTTTDFFKHFKYGKKRPIEFDKGDEFSEVFDLVLGAEVAKRLNYSLNDPIVLAHGIAATSFSMHDQHPFKVVGILEPTGTPVDQTLLVSLEGIEAIHENWQTGFTSQTKLDAEVDLTRESITAFMVGLTSRMSTFRVQRSINQYQNEPMTAILPGVALSELWQIMGSVENILLLISYLVLLASLLGLSAMLLASIRERHQEIQLLRVIGAPAWYIFLIVELEAILIAIISTAISLCVLWLGLFSLQDTLLSEFGLQVSGNIFTLKALTVFGILLATTIVAAAIPSAMAYRTAKVMIK